MVKVKPIKGYPNYIVTSNGKVYNIKTNLEKSPGKDTKGYLKVDLYRSGRRRTFKIHRLVADAFLPEDPKRIDINHIDGNKHNNKLSNLERVTRSENMIHAYRTGLAHPKPHYGMLGKKNPNGGSKGKPIEIIETGEQFKSTAECARQKHIREKGINDCLKGRQHTHRGFHFRYV